MRLAGGLFDRIIPRSVATRATDPLFRLIELQVSVDEFALRYRGNAEFEYVGEGSEREIGKLEMALSFLPAVYALIPIVLISVFMGRGVVTFGLLCVFTVYALLAIRMLNEVSVEHIPVDERDAIGGWGWSP